MYSNVNAKTKKELEERIAAGEKIGIHQPGPFGGNEPTNGKVYLEGPHYPQPHRWYAEAWVENGILVKIK